MSRIYPVILSGGSGVRLWPLSRQNSPKQFLKLTSDRTLLQETALRVNGKTGFEGLTVIGHESQRFRIAEQLAEVLDTNARIVLEPVGRNTGPALAAAALLVAKDDPEGLLLVMPADHHVGDVTAFLNFVQAGVAAAEAGALVLFGIHPRHAATGYGYIRVGETYCGAAHRVAKFVEKPDLLTAERFVRSGEYLWNSGIFLLPVQRVLSELGRYEPDLLSCVSDAVERAEVDRDFVRLAAEPFSRSPSISIDHGLMERTEFDAVVPTDFEWSDVGSWSALWALAAKDGVANAINGEAVTHDAQGCYIHSTGPLVAAVEVADLVVIATREAVLVSRRGADEGLKDLVDRLRDRGGMPV